MNLSKPVLLSGSALLLGACQSLPDLAGRSVSTYIESESAPRLEAALPAGRPSEKQTEQSGVYLLADPHDAFVARAVLIEHADRTLDIAYYIWHNDVSGKMLFQMLQQAARRGVRVRLLLDDNNTRGMDDVLAALDAEANIEIRLFNPFTHRRFRALGYLTDFPRLNRRMHNKSLTADNRYTIVGGRNIGDEYFNVSTETGFADLDVLARGTVVTDVSQDFDRYWASGSSYPFADIAKRADAEKGRLKLNRSRQSDAAVRESYLEDLRSSPLAAAVDSGTIPWLYADARLVSDDPAKGLSRSREKPSVADKLFDTLGEPQRDLFIVSPYFVPSKWGMNAIRAIRKKGVAVTVLTNSLRATDVAAVHSGYARYRKALLEAGVGLYEVKPDFAPPKARDKGLTGSSATSLHAKTFVVDDKRVFIGSLNFDPRSARLNTEMGIVLDSREIASRMRQELAQMTPEYAYKVVLDRQKKRLRWQDPDQPDTLLKKEPDAGLWKRLLNNILSLLPIEKLL
ncbi:phospholipase D domain protein [Neisseria sp. oral taxon 020 str. F0370]|uniref:phospholipase D family protein n=1 Tax=unclassified Neisseria TaxID=2623750 RepID=UPI0002A3A672|nr:MULTISPECIES: phospholipase D family protein [unclassified Neisseria]ASP17168.1 phospholipase D family protein [Neisseria sp. KEM232]EKY07837.1 phospholipase D domain protein [Neisseria sp. oral taxon 020 str. F0370]